MAANLIALLEQLLGSNEVLSRIGSLIGLSPERSRSAIGAVVPAIWPPWSAWYRNPEAAINSPPQSATRIPACSTI